MATTTNYAVNPLTPPTSINATTAGNQLFTDIVSLGNGNSAVFYGASTFNGASTLYARLIGPNGLPASAEAMVATGVDDGLDRFANATVLNNGNVVVTWADANTYAKVHYRVYDQNLNPVTGVLDINTPANGRNHPDVTALSNGGFAIAYEAFLVSTRSIVYSTFDGTGAQVLGPITVDNSANLDELPSIAGLSNGNIAIGFDRRTAGNSTAYVAVFNSLGGSDLAATPFDISGTHNYAADVVALANGGFAINYIDNGWMGGTSDDITTARFDANGLNRVFTRDSTSNVFDEDEQKGAVSADGYQLVAFQSLGGTIGELGTLFAPGGAELLVEAPLDNGVGGRNDGAVTWIDASHVAFAEYVYGIAAGGDGDGAGVASRVFEVVRTTSGDSAAPLDFSGDGIDNIVNLGAGNDTVFGGKGTNYIIGNGGDDVLIGGAGGNTIYALGGSSYIQGGTGSPSDLLVATGSGNDTFYGGTGDNYIVGGAGKNTIVGGGGPLETLYGSGSLGDYIVGGYGAGASSVLVENGAGSAQLWGGLGGTNYEVGGDANDLVVGGPNSDYLFGGNGDDTIYGGNGTDYIYPGPGNDFIWTDNIGTASTDYVYEGVGTGVDTVADFTPGDVANHDVLVLTAASSQIASFADVQAKAFQAGIYTVLPISNTDQVYLYNVQPFQLTANDFIFT